MQVKEKPSKPEVELLPRVLNTPSRLICRFGWDDVTTAAFWNTEFEELQLRGGPQQSIDIPPLGPKAAAVKRLVIAASGSVTGLDQFAGVETLDVAHVPKDRVVLESFRKLRSLFLEWNPTYGSVPPHVSGLRELGLMGFPEVPQGYLEAFPDLRALSITQGKVQSLPGLSKCRRLTDVALAYLPKFDDFGCLQNCISLKKLSITNLPKLVGMLDLSQWRELQNLYVVGADLTVDLSAIGALKNLEQLWLAVPHENGDWREILSNIRLMTIGLLEMGSAIKDDDLRAISAGLGRTIPQIVHVGPKKGRQIQITFERNMKKSGT